MENKKYAIIVDKGECMSTINENTQFIWKSEAIHRLAGKSEWLKNNFYPENGMVGEIVDSFENTLWHFTTYVLCIDDKFYVAMSQN